MGIRTRRTYTRKYTCRRFGVADSRFMALLALALALSFAQLFLHA